MWIKPYLSLGGNIKRWSISEATTILSLFDYSGVWSKPYRDVGYHVVQVDKKLGLDIFDDIMLDIVNSFEPYGILAAPPCTDFAASGRAWFKQKDKDGRTAESLKLIDRTLEIIEWAKPNLMFWALEQPVGRLPKLRPTLGRHKLWFHPWHYAGYLHQEEVDESELTPGQRLERALHSEQYSKMTLLYGEFNANLIKKPLPNKYGSLLQLKYGGNSERTKELRSRTPYGFSLAFHNANP